MPIIALKVNRYSRLIKMVIWATFTAMFYPNALGQTNAAVCIDCCPGQDTLDGEYVFTVVAQMPEYPGGMTALAKYLSKHLKYIHQGEQFIGSMTISFIIDVNGLVRGECLCLPTSRVSLTTQEKEALQAIRQMPPWIPGKQNGKHVPVRYRLPIRF